jgi:choline dehydrogenase-like flavoprotein
MQQTFRAILEGMGGQIAAGGGRGGGRGNAQTTGMGASPGQQAPQTGQAGPQTGIPTVPAGQPTTGPRGNAPAVADANRVPISRGGGIIHEVGTVRMGDDPRTSPLNKYCQAHEVKNLFVADGAPFVSNADKNPTHTIIALAWRTAEYLAEEMRKGNV